MSTGAIIMMIIAILVLWGGLAAATINLSRSKDGEVAEAHRDL